MILLADILEDLEEVDPNEDYSPFPSKYFAMLFMLQNSPQRLVSIYFTFQNIIA